MAETSVIEYKRIVFFHMSQRRQYGIYILPFGTVASYIHSSDWQLVFGEETVYFLTSCVLSMRGQAIFFSLSPKHGGSSSLTVDSASFIVQSMHPDANLI